LQTVIEAGYQQFLTVVADEREMDVDAVDEIAQGRIWTGAKAQELGLVDELGNLEQAISAAARLASINDYSLWYVEPTLSTREKLILQFAETMTGSLSNVGKNPVSNMLSIIRSDIGFLENLNDPSHAYVICADCPAVQ